MKILISFLIILIFTSSGFSQSTAKSSERELQGGLGLCAGVVSGTGFSYRYYPTDGKIGLNVGSIFVVDGEYRFFNLGIEPLLVLHRSEKMGFYGIFGLSVCSVREERDEWIGYNRKYFETNTEMAVGAGVGVSFIRYERLVLSCEMLMTARKNSLYPMPQGSLHYLLW